MNKLNALGMEVLDYKSEYLKDYPKLVHDSIALAIDNKSEIEEDIKNKLKDMSIKKDDFKKYLLKQPSCLKTYEELLIEYESIRESIDIILRKNEISKEIKSFSKVEEENIQLIQEFVITEEFIKNYFTIDTEKDFEVLMSRKGFIEKFAILRLTKILNDFSNSIKKDENFNIKHSLVFFNSEKNVYGIHLEYTIPIDILENNSKTEIIGTEISKISEKADKNFKERMLI